MTTQQQNIIDSLVAEFNKINTPTPSGFARIGEALDKCNEWDCLVSGVTASNARFEELREQMIETDYNRLVEECRLGGIDVRIHKSNDAIYIDNHHGYNHYTDNKIAIRYEFFVKMHVSDTRKSVNEIKSIKLRSSHTYGDCQYSSIDKLFENDLFFNAWTKLIEISRK